MEKHNTMKSTLLIIVTILWGFSIFLLSDSTLGIITKLVLSLVELFLVLFNIKENKKIVKPVLITIVWILLLTWIFPAAYYSGEYIDQGRVQMGLSELFNYPMTALSYFGHIALFIIFVGGFYGVLYKIPAYRTFLDKIVKVFERKEKLFLAIVIVLLSLGVSIAGAQIGFAMFIPFIVAIILLMGYDKIVAALVVVGSLSAGLIGSTYAYNNLSLLNSILSLDIDYQLGVRFVILAVAVVLVIVNTFIYISKYLKNVTISNTNAKAPVENSKKNEEVKEEVVVKEEKVESKPSAKNASSKKSTSSKSSSKSTKSSSSKKGKSKSKNNNKAALRDEDIIVVKESVMSDSDSDDYLVPTRVGTTHRVWPFVVTFLLLFVLLVMAFITWGDGGFGITLFDEVTENVVGYELFGFPIFSKVYGAINSFGNWTLIDFFLPMALVLAILTFIYKVKFNDVLDGFAEGAKKALAPAFVALLLYTILVTTTYHPFQMSIYKAILGLTKGFNIATTAIVGFLSTVFNVDSAYVFQNVIPYYTSVVSSSDNYPIAGVIFQSMYGFASLIAPTSLVLMGTLAYLKVNYKEWLKNAWKLLLELFVVLLIIFIILALI